MPKLRNTNTGVVVETSEKVAARLGSEWEPVDVKPEKAKQKPSKKS